MVKNNRNLVHEDAGRFCNDHHSYNYEQYLQTLSIVKPLNLFLIGIIYNNLIFPEVFDQNVLK